MTPLRIASLYAALTAALVASLTMVGPGPRAPHAATTCDPGRIDAPPTCEPTGVVLPSG